MNVAKEVVAALNSVIAAQKAAESASDEATKDISATRSQLQQIANETQAAAHRANASLIEVEQFNNRVKEMKYMYNINKRHLDDTKSAVEQSKLKAYKASNEAIGLEDVSEVST